MNGEISSIQGIYGEAFVHSTFVSDERRFIVVAQFDVLPNELLSQTWNGEDNDFGIDIDMSVNLPRLGYFYSQVKAKLNSNNLLIDLSGAYSQLKYISILQNPANLLPTVYGFDTNTVYAVWLQEYIIS